jgi:pimeloyl-ACP methyl ester carboxylesterase
MTKEKIIIKNKDNKKIVVIIEKPDEPIGLAFVMHGLGGNKDQPHISTFTEAFLESNYTVVRFDTRNTFGESVGNYEDANITNYFDDLTEVIDWAKIQSWYIEPFCLVGHSLGGISVSLFAEKYPKKVKALAPISTVVSGELNIDNTSKENLYEWEKTGWRTSLSSSIPGLIKKLKWQQYKKDIQKYDLLKDIKKLTMPVLLIVGDKDDSTPLKHQQIFYDKLPGKKEIHIIKNAPHTFKDKEHLEEIKNIFKKWISNL